MGLSGRRKKERGEGGVGQKKEEGEGVGRRKELRGAREEATMEYGKKF